LVSALAALSLAGCGGGSSSDTPVKKTAVSGSAVAGAVDGRVVVRDAGGHQVVTGTVSGGDFSLQIPDSALDGELEFVVTGSYTDEVSGDAVTLDATHPLGLRLAANRVTAGTAATVGITPETTVIRELVANHGMTLANALAVYAAELGNSPDGSGRPYDPTGAAPAWADAANDVTYRVGAYSQFGTDLGLGGNDLAALPGALAADLADGVLDGLDGGGNNVTVGAVDLHTLHQASMLAARYMTAMATFDTSAANAAGVPAPTMGLPPNGKITEVIANGTPAARVVSINGTEVNVSVQLNNPSPFSAMGPTTSRNVFRVTLTKVSDGSAVDVTAGGGSPVTGISASSLMHMMGMSHSTPMSSAYDPATSNPAAGIYQFSVYYVMASAMSMGGMTAPMGVWDLDFALTDGTNTATASFHPNVTMPMGSNLSARGVSDQDGRMYWVWLDSAKTNAGGGHDIGVFVTTKVGMTFPAVYDGASHMAMGDSLTITGVTVEASLDDATWTTLTEDGNGYFSLSGYPGLTADAAGKDDLSVRLTLDIGGVTHHVSFTGGLTFTVP
jgi:hypothetical protein